MTDNRDGSGTLLTDYPRPFVAVDTAILTVQEGQLCVAVLENERLSRRLPGRFVREGETLADAVRRSLRQKLGIRGLAPQQLHVFDAPGRDSRGWVMSVAHIAAVSDDRLAGVTLLPVAEATGLAFDHDEMVRLAVREIRAAYAEHPDPWDLLDSFTLRELRTLHAAIDPDTPLRDSFRRIMEPQLIETGELSSGGVGKPSRIFTKPSLAERQRQEEARQLTLDRSRRASRSRRSPTSSDYSTGPSR